MNLSFHQTNRGGGQAPQLTIGATPMAAILKIFCLRAPPNLAPALTAMASAKFLFGGDGVYSAKIYSSKTFENF